jgi:menaquinone-dependent protoporphyrinogen oxidase
VKVLVAYASKRGSTAEIAEAVASTLAGSGLEVECEDAASIKSLEPYDALVLGSAVYMKRWRGDARRFLRRHRRALTELPFWVFSSGPVGDPAEDRPEWTEPSKIVASAERLGARGHVVFGGRLPAEPKGKIERAMVIGVPPEFRDRRDWDEIRDWAKTVAQELAAPAPQRGTDGSTR